MSDSSQLDRTFQIIMKRMMVTGQAPHFTEIAAELGVSLEEGRKTLHELYSPGFPGWLFPNTDYICSFPPFSNLPTQYRITVDDQQKWFGQWGFESLAVSWLFPSKTVKIDAPCLDCGSPIRVEMKDGKILNAEPEGIIGYTSVPFKDWFNDLPYTWSTMNLFRSEEHVRNWSGFKANTDEGINKLSDIAGLFSGNFFSKRLDPDYASRMQDYFMELIGILKGMGPFWQPPEQWLFKLSGSYDLHTSNYDEETRVAVFFATNHAKHTGEGGPVPPTQKETHSHYAYLLTMSTENKVERMVKIWNVL